MGHQTAFLVAALLLAGCQSVRYDMRPPTSEVGRLCVTQCGTTRESCRGNEIMRAKGEQDACERRARNQVRSCLNSADSKEQRSKCERGKSSCYSHENDSHCDEEYRACYRQCGGTVTKIIEK
ncbi:MAG: hypothetical protein HQL63_05205 [Magnetococcales bacterium]|nr:hypothetical protein [Magnetococcales bacterium]